jgi:hypothetical protein
MRIATVHDLPSPRWGHSIDVTFSTIIVSYRTPDLTERAARSALAAADDGEVIVVDNASGDATLERLAAIANPRLAVIANERNVGFGTAANVGARRAGGDVLLFLNSDATLTPEAAAALVAEVGAQAGRAIAAPRLVEPDGTVQRSVGLLPEPGDLTLRAMGLQRIAGALAGVPAVGSLLRGSRMGREYGTAVASAGPRDVSMISGACFAVGREAFLELGCFDEGYFMYLEDADLCRRAAAAGFRLRYLPQVSVEHVGGASSEDDYHFSPLYAPSLVRYLGRWYGRPGRLLAIVLLAMRAAGMTLALRPDARRARAALRAVKSPDT